MSALLAALLIAVLLTFVIWALSGPFRGNRAQSSAAAESDERQTLESAKQAKYSEIRDNEADYRTGKLSEQDFRSLDRLLRAEAVEILRAIDRLDAPDAAPSH
jgi:type II secretory pathway pseudopilin PulG